MGSEAPHARRRSPARKPVQAGFTLVEVLVVIGIIALLIAILMPALNQARAQARKVACLSNMKQIGIALIMYANDSKGYFPFQDESPGLGAGGVGNFATSTKLNWISAILPYLNNNTSVLVCPDAYYPIAFGGGDEPTATSDTNYMGNGVIMGGMMSANGVWQTKSLSQIPNTAGIICLQENVWDVNEAWLRPYISSSTNGNNTYILWHSVYGGWPGETYCSIHDNNQSGNVIFCDGHGETRYYKQNEAGDFGLNPPYTKWSLTNESGANGVAYTPAF